MTTLKTVWTDTYEIYWRDVNSTCRAGIDSICGYLQETAWRHANHLGVGYEKMRDNKNIWVLVRMLIEMDEYPVWGQTIQISTWPSGSDGLLAFRDYRITDAKGKTIGEGSSAWMVIDQITRRPQKFEGIAVPDARNGHTRLQIGRAAKITLPQKMESRGTQKIQFTDLDSHGHTTNTKYASLLINSFDSEWHKEKMLKTFEINFMHESLISDELQIRISNPDNGSYFLSALRQSDNKSIVNARLEWEPTL